MASCPGAASFRVPGGETLDKLDKLEKFSRTMDILTNSEELRLIYGVVLKPDSEDLQGDVVSKDDIRQAAHDFLISSREVGISHRHDPGWPENRRRQLDRRNQGRL